MSKTAPSTKPTPNHGITETRETATILAKYAPLMRYLEPKDLADQWDALQTVDLQLRLELKTLSRMFSAEMERDSGSIGHMNEHDFNDAMWRLSRQMDELSRVVGAFYDLAADAVIDERRGTSSRAGAR